MATDSGNDNVIEIKAAYSEAVTNANSGSSVSRLEEWQKKLLDLTRRNSLLNFKSRKTSVAIECPEIGALEDLLASGKQVRVVPLPQDSSQNSAPPTQEEIQQLFEEKKLLARLDSVDLEKRMLGLMRTTKRDLQEGDANTLFLALGSLRWKEPESRTNDLNRAPLILLPIVLERQNARSEIIICGTDEDARINVTLLELLKLNFGIRIPELEGDLPKDEHGLDVERIYQILTDAAQKFPEWSLKRDAVVSNFSFARYLMWKDLSEQPNALKENSLVKHLVDTPNQEYQPGGSFPQPSELDRKYPPANIFMPLPTDSSQMAAALAAAVGRDFVLIGPPGTGKSQSIVNMIAHCLAEGKKVLFVSAKKAALDVVYRRLRDVGLDDFCLDVHSSKNSNTKAYEQLKRAANREDKISTNQDWEHETSQILQQRNLLNLYVERLHHEYPNGLTPYRVMGKLLTAPEMPVIKFFWHDPATHTLENYEKMRSAAQAMALSFPQELQAEARKLLKAVRITQWSSTAENDFANKIQKTAQQLRLFDQNRINFLDALLHEQSTQKIHSHSSACTALLKIAQEIVKSQNQCVKVLFDIHTPDLKQQLQTALTMLETLRKEWSSLSCEYQEDVISTLDLNQLEAQWGEADSVMWPLAFFAKRSVLRIFQTATVSEQKPYPARDIPHLQQWKETRIKLDEFDMLTKSTFGLWRGANTNVADLKSCMDDSLKIESEINTLIAQCSTDASTQESIRCAILLLLQNTDKTSAQNAAQEFVNAYRQLEPLLKQLPSTLNTPFHDLINSSEDMWITTLAQQCEQWNSVSSNLRTWAKWQQARQAALEADLAPLIEALENNVIQPNQTLRAFELNYQRWWIRAVIDTDTVLRDFSGKEQDLNVRTFAKNIDNYLHLTKDYIRYRIIARQQTPRSKEDEEAMGMLTRELKKKARFRPLRQMITVAPDAVLRLTPCMMMSPLSVAQFLALGKPLFDLVIFDEASQIPVWDSIGALARGKQSVIVGDPKQMPPMNYFNRSNDEEDQEEDNWLESAESILDECIASRVTTLDLNWHYRSRHENLIAFSNHHYYEDKLITFPAPQTEDTSVSFHYMTDGIYTMGAGQNVNEAKAVVADIVAHLKAPSPIGKKLTVGVVTFNQKQQTLIENLLENERRNDPSIEKWFNDSELEPVMVKNLDTVQGDERDIMYFSVTFGPTIEGTISMNFGPLNKDGGERRLNVAITRARNQLKVFSSLRPEQIDLSRTAKPSVSDFKHFLEFAERGATSFAREADETGRPFESCFEEAVSYELTRRGWKVRPQVGVAKFRIDLGIVHPDYPGTYLAGVECDGATYHSAATARDRDKVREGVLRGLGWEILRVWSTDWWANPRIVADRLDEKLRELKQKALPPVKPIISTPAIIHPTPEKAPDKNETHEDDVKVLLPQETTTVEASTPTINSHESQSKLTTEDRSDEKPKESEKRASLPVTSLFSSQATTPTISEATSDKNETHREHVKVLLPWETTTGETDPAPIDFHALQPKLAIYEPVNFDDLNVKPDAERFYDTDYKSTLLSITEKVIMQEGPILESLLIKRIARAHGFARAGERIRTRLYVLVKDKFYTSRESRNIVFWPSREVHANWQTFREPDNYSEPRSIDEIPLDELFVLALIVGEKESENEVILRTMAKHCGVNRLGEQVRSRLEKALFSG